MKSRAWDVCLTRGGVCDGDRDGDGMEGGDWTG